MPRQLETKAIACMATTTRQVCHKRSSYCVIIYKMVCASPNPSIQCYPSLPSVWPTNETKKRNIPFDTPCAYASTFCLPTFKIIFEEITLCARLCNTIELELVGCWLRGWAENSEFVPTTTHHARTMHAYDAFLAETHTGKCVDNRTHIIFMASCFSSHA